MRKIWLGLMFALVAGAGLAMNFPCGTFVIAGGAKNEAGALYDKDDAVKILAVATNGTVLASSNISNPYEDGANAFNFCLSVPLATGPSSLTAQVGDTVNLVLNIDGVTNIATCPVTLTKANGGTNLFVQVWDTLSYTNSDQSVAIVSRRYVEEIQSWVDAYGYGTYDPFADYDGDGRSNYREYLDGTDAFNETDYLHITAYAIANSKLHAISFEYSGGRVYGLSATTNFLAASSWKARQIKATAAGTLQDQVAYEGAEEDVGPATLYVVPAEGVTSEFFIIQTK